MIEEWISALDNGNMVWSITIDRSYAFDNLLHGLLLAKIYAYGVHIESCELIASHPHNRHHWIKIRDKRSDWLQRERGLPQGSVIGPLLFNILLVIYFCFTVTITSIIMQTTTAYHLLIISVIYTYSLYFTTTWKTSHIFKNFYSN